jgi:hypothetical protein
MYRLVSNLVIFCCSTIGQRFIVEAHLMTVEKCNSVDISCEFGFLWKIADQSLLALRTISVLPRQALFEAE